jgi:RNA 3'-terminal phosphate cyclase
LFAVGSAGSTPLVLQTLLPALLAHPGESDITIDGGTHAMSVLFILFLQDVFVPVLRQLGVDIEITRVRPGFYPAGGGRIRSVIRRLGRATDGFVRPLDATTIRPLKQPLTNGAESPRSMLVPIDDDAKTAYNHRLKSSRPAGRRHADAQ